MKGSARTAAVKHAQGKKTEMPYAVARPALIPQTSVIPRTANLQTAKPQGVFARSAFAAAFGVWVFLALPASAFDPAPKASASAVPTGTVRAAEHRITDADLRDMARKLRRARPAGALGKTASAGPSALASMSQGRTQFGPAAPFSIPIPSLSRPALPPGLRVHWNGAAGTPSFLEGPGLSAPRFTSQAAVPGARALAYFQQNKGMFRLHDPASELRFESQAADDLGSRHETFQQMFQGVPVWGATLNAHFDRAGAMYAVNARYAPTPDAIAGPGYRVSEAQAVALAEADLARHTPLEDFAPETRKILAYPGPAAAKNVWMESAGTKAHWAWRVEIRPIFRDNWRYFIDGATGAILEKYNASNADGPKVANATDLLGATVAINTYQVGTAYYLIDATRKSFNAKGALPNDPKGALWTLDAGSTDLAKVSQVSSKTNAWTDPAAVSAHGNTAKVFEYYLNAFGRLGIDGAGSSVISAVHVTEKGQKMDNAYWNGKAMCYGDGNTGFKPLARALDVAAHEMTHGVIDATVNLEYKFQSGALNESMADVFGAMVDGDDWKIGEDVVNPAVFKSGALRDMEDPHNGATGPSQNGWQPAHMDEFQTLKLEDDNGGVHVNSGIPNHACALIAKAIGREKTGKIYYRVMSAKYLNPGSQFIDMRLAAIRSATDLFGEASPEVAAVKDGFAAVGIGSASVPDKPTERPSDAPPVSGQEFVALVNADPGDNSLYAARPVIAGDSDIVQVTTTQVYTGTGNPIAITDDGSTVLFITADHALHGIDDSGEQVVSAEGVWKSVAVSPDGGKVAVTKTEDDAKIYILDLVNPDDSKTVSLYTPTTGLAVKANNVVYADALDFSSTGEFLLYDALNRVTQAEGDPIEYFDANLLDVKSGIITPFLPTRPDGISIGNPSFAQTSDVNLAFDLYDEATNTWSVIAGDLFTGSFQVIDSNGTTPGFPRYSTMDDKIVYERADGDARNVQQAALAKDKITPAGAPVSYVKNAQKPVWFAIGKRPTGIRLPGAGKPGRYVLRGDAGGGLRLDLPVAADVVVTAYDVSGRKLGELFRGRRGAGSYRLGRNGIPGTGICLVRMVARPATGAPVTLARKLAL